GDCVAAGYIHRPELTAERFVEVDGTRWYRSGDRVRRDKTGVLEYLGRMDAQVKIDGFRIEPAEIETVLCRHPAVAEAVVVAAENAGGRHLVAHIVPREARTDERALAALLRSHCEAMLAPYLVPRAFHVHAALPLTASGKIDRRALENGFANATLQWLEGAALAQQLLHLWKQLLGMDALDVDANLFENGARSLLVVRALTELRRHGHVLSAAQIYESPTICAQVALLETGTTKDAHSSVAERARGAAQRTAFARFGAHGGGQR
ncbi:MAG TPA: non-ribosomal peptide synthetase, partial [Rhodanobacteraceae bacterium]|nr:non-ribosomal peptide synthetase [Rhodanobacteraceae bacterium]